MAYSVDAKTVRAHEPKALPVILLLDVSGSMAGEKIDRLNEAVRTMATLLAEEERREMFSRIAIIEFADRAALCNAAAPYAAPEAFLAQYQDLTAAGCTALGGALKEARELIEDKTRTKGRSYRPAVVLVSDGEPVENDGNDWKEELARFEAAPRCQKCQRFAIAIGEGANQNILRRFVGAAGELHYAADAGEIVKMFRRVTLSMTQSVSKIHEAATGTGKQRAPFHIDSLSTDAGVSVRPLRGHHAADDDAE